MPTILVEQCCYDWISGDISRVHPCYGNMHGNSRQASGGDRLPENYAAISATNLWFPRNGLCSSDHFRFIIRTSWLKLPKQVRLLIRHYLLLSLQCIVSLVSRYKRWRMVMRHLIVVSRYVWGYRDTWVAIRYAYRRPKYRDASMNRCIVTTLAREQRASVLCG